MVDPKIGAQQRQTLIIPGENDGVSQHSNDVGAGEPPVAQGRLVDGQPWTAFQSDRSTGAPTVQTVGRSKAEAKGHLSFFGTSIPRLGDPVDAAGLIGRTTAKIIAGLFADGPLGTDAYRTSTFVNKALAVPLAKEGFAHFGGTNVYHPGLGNTEVGPANIGRLAQYGQEVVIAFANPGVGAEREVRSLESLRNKGELPERLADLEHLPLELREKIKVVGSPEPIMISHNDAADVLLGHLDTLGKKGVSVTAHSQGTLAAVQARAAATRAGHSDVFKNLNGITPPLEGSPVSNETLLGAFTEIAGLTGAEFADAVNKLDPDDRAIQGLGKLADLHLDTSVVGRVRSGAKESENVRGLFGGLLGTSAVISIQAKASNLVRGLPLLSRKTVGNPALLKSIGLSEKDAQSDNDGMVTVGSMAHGKRLVVIDDPLRSSPNARYEDSISLDHAGAAEVLVIDAIARALD